MNEWICSEYEKSYDGNEAKCTDHANRYSLRGGSWGYEPRDVRSAARIYGVPADRSSNLGFRLARDK